MTASLTNIAALLRQARRLRGARASALPLLLFFTDPDRTPDAERVLPQLPRGAAIVVRAFGRPEALAQARRLARLARRRGLIFIVGADPGLARNLRADGLHLPARAASQAKAMKARFRFVTCAAHDRAELRRARAADALVLSPIFPSNSPSAAKPLGPRAAVTLARVARRPIYALGGLTAANARLLPAGVFIGVAGIDMFRI